MAPVVPSIFPENIAQSELGCLSPTHHGGGRVGYRIFKDSHGTEWQTWDVVPRLEERRVSERRMYSSAPAHTDRRSRLDRRILTGHRAVLMSGFDGGWLCFQADVEKRRLTPIPDDWQRCAEERLEQYCARATPARRATRELRAVDPGEP